MRVSFKPIASLISALLLMLLPIYATAAPVGGGQASPSSAIKAYGCDVSFWNVGGYYPDYSRIDFERMKADGCDFVILRVGFEGTGSRQNTIDDAFVRLYNAAKQAGLGVGAYFYALATTYEGAAEDAAWCIDLFEQYNMSFEYPIYYDIEDPGNGADRPGHDALNDDEMTALSLGWAQTLEAAGYFPGVYSDYETVVKLKPAYTDHYDIWYAYVAYVEGIPEFIPEEQDHSGFCGLWQYSWKGTFDGAVGELDVNVAYQDYPTIMKKNGYNNFDPEWDSSLSLLPEHFGFSPYAYNDAAEGIVPTYHGDGTVTLTNTVSDAAWSWPSAYMLCRREVDMRRFPLLQFQKSGTANFNAVLQYIAPDGSYQSINIASLAEEANGEFGSGDMTVRVDIAAYLRRQGHLPSDGIVNVVGITYFIMGSNNTYLTLQSAGFVAAPIPDELTSPHHIIDDRFIVVPFGASLTVDALLAGFDNSHGVIMRNERGEALLDHESVGSSMTINIELDGALIRSYIFVLGGDLNGDSFSNTVDARLALTSMLDSNLLSEWQKRAADIDHDGAIRTADVRTMLLDFIS